MNAQITVVIPTVKNRNRYLRRAVDSVKAQTWQPIAVEIAIDREREGSAVTRNRALDRVKTPLVAFLDDDDFFLPHHIQVLVEAMTDSGSDVEYSGCRVIGPDYKEIPRQPEWGRFGEPFDAALLMHKSYIPVTCLARTDLAKEAKFGPPEHRPNSPYDDWGFYTRLYQMGATFHHVPEVTWVWHHHGLNSSGMSDRT